MAHIKLPEFEEMTPVVQEKARPILEETGQLGEIFKLLAIDEKVYFATDVMIQKYLLDETTLSMKHKTGDIWIAPEIIGSKSGVFTAIAGAVLVIAGAVLTYYGMGGVGIPMMKMGAGLMLSGVIMMLTPVPGTPEYKERESPDERQGFLFDGPVNTNEQGGAIPITYGKVLVGSTIVSTSLDVEDIPLPEPVVEEEV